MRIINVFIPHRWNSNDYETISSLLERTKFQVKDSSVTKNEPLEKIDGRFLVDPQLKAKIDWAGVIVCSNRPSNSNGIAIEEIKYALSKNKPVVAIQISNNTSTEIRNLNIPIIQNRKDSLENWINNNK
ncbi:MAG: hypothetical protein FWF57_06680 [Defluviitaleaceae bacterium]|nr:hypothetical protein [Defluviitaleaceae bacterium]